MDPVEAAGEAMVRVECKISRGRQCPQNSCHKHSRILILSKVKIISIILFPFVQGEGAFTGPSPFKAFADARSPDRHSKLCFVPGCPGIPGSCELE